MWGNGKPARKSYQELAVEAARRWGEIARIRDEKARMLNQEINNSADVRARPDPTQPWSSPGIQCPACQGKKFFVRLWVCVNGQRHRFEATCTSCAAVHTYDWGSGAWLVP